MLTDGYLSHLTPEAQRYVKEARERARANPLPKRQPMSDAEWERMMNHGARGHQEVLAKLDQLIEAVDRREDALTNRPYQRPSPAPPPPPEQSKPQTRQGINL